MEVVGVVGSIVGIVDVIARSTSALIKLNHELRQADTSLLTMIGELGTTKAALEQLGQLVSAVNPECPGSYQFEIDLGYALTAAKGLVTIIDEKISSLARSDANTDRLKFEGRVRLVLTSAGFEQSLVRLGRLLNAMNVLITAFNSRTASQQTHFLQQPDARDALEKVREDSASLKVLYDDASFETKISSSTAGLSAYSKEFDFDNALLNTKLYKLNIRSLMKRRVSRSIVKTPIVDGRVRTALETEGYVLLAKIDSLEKELTHPVSGASPYASMYNRADTFRFLKRDSPIYILCLEGSLLESIRFGKRLKSMRQSCVLPSDEVSFSLKVHRLQCGHAVMKELISWPALFNKSLNKTALLQLDLRGMEILRQIDGAALHDHMWIDLKWLEQSCQEILRDIRAWSSEYKRPRKVTAPQPDEIYHASQRLKTYLDTFCPDPDPEEVPKSVAGQGLGFRETSIIYPGSPGRKDINLRILLPRQAYLPLHHDWESFRGIPCVLVPAQVYFSAGVSPDDPDYSWFIGPPMHDLEMVSRQNYFLECFPNSVAIWLLFVTDGWHRHGAPALLHLEPGQPWPSDLLPTNRKVKSLQALPDYGPNFENDHAFFFDMTVPGAFEDGFAEVAKLVQHITEEKQEIIGEEYPEYTQPVLMRKCRDFQREMKRLYAEAVNAQQARVTWEDYDVQSEYVANIM